MEQIINTIEIPLTELEDLKKTLKKSKKAIALIEESERKFNDVKRMIVEQCENNPDISREYVENQLIALRKFVQLLLRGNLSGVMLKRTQQELIETCNEIKRLHDVIKQKDEEIQIYKEKCNEYYDMIEENESTREELEDIKDKYERALESSRMNLQNRLRITPLFNMSLGKEEDFVAFISYNQESLAEARKVRENSTSVTYEIDKTFIDKLKDDKRKSPKINKKDKILVTKSKN